jgi:hypothetical protein
MLPPAVTQRARIEHGDADGRFDQRLLTQRRGDDHFFQHVIVGRDGRRGSQQGRAEEWKRGVNPQEMLETMRHRQIL